ncbi:uncharacterized protein TNCV_3920741 [Trichonephila clavipes]|nr:uncharacterized protein TNCV_3920741 [Trichonephila clavipes]
MEPNSLSRGEVRTDCGYSHCASRVELTDTTALVGSKSQLQISTRRSRVELREHHSISHQVFHCKARDPHVEAWREGCPLSCPPRHSTEVPNHTVYERRVRYTAKDIFEAQRSAKVGSTKTENSQYSLPQYIETNHSARLTISPAPPMVAF